MSSATGSEGYANESDAEQRRLAVRTRELLLVRCTWDGRSCSVDERSGRPERSRFAVVGLAAAQLMERGPTLRRGWPLFSAGAAVRPVVGVASFSPSDVPDRELLSHGVAGRSTGHVDPVTTSAVLGRQVCAGVFASRSGTSMPGQRLREGTRYVRVRIVLLRGTSVVHPEVRAADLYGPTLIASASHVAPHAWRFR
jgi:hypothetical protein